VTPNWIARAAQRGAAAWLVASALAQAVLAAPAEPGLSPLELAVVEPGLRPFLEEALRAEGQAELERAASNYRVVLLRDPTVVPAVLGLGRVLLAQGDTAGADEVYASLPSEADVVFARAALLEQRDPETALELYRRLETLAIDSTRPYLRQAVLLAAFDPPAALQAIGTYLDLEDGPPALDGLLELALALSAAGELEQAGALLDEVSQRWPTAEGLQELQGLRDRIGVEREAARLAIGGAVPLLPPQRVELDTARAAFVASDMDGAQEILASLVGRAPRAPEVWLLHGDVQLALGAVDEAERAYLTATSLAPHEARYHARLGLLLAERYGGRWHREAIAELNAALGLRPTWAELHFRLARLQRETGDFEDALASLRSYLELEPAGDHAAEARALVQDLTRRRPASQDEVLAAPAADVPDPARKAYLRARIYRRRGDVESARGELEAALELAPDYCDALKLLAALELGEGRSDPALQAYERCLRSYPQDPGLLLSLAELRRSIGQEEEALVLYRRAAEAGAPEAWYVLASLAADKGQLWQARRHLRAYFQQGSGGLVQEPAQALRRRLDSRIRAIELGAGLALALLLLLPGIWLLRRRTGASLRTLLDREPSSYQKVARLLSAIRHEVLKHNTTLLSTVSQRLEGGEGEAALYAAERLFGEGTEQGVVRKFEGYLDALQGIGREYGLRLNLRRKDPVLGPMHRAMRRLGRLESTMRRPHRSGTARLARELRALSEVLNEEGYRAIGELIRSVCVLNLDLRFFSGVYQQVAAEPKLDGQTPQLELEGGDLRVPARIFRKDLEDIAANLLRNALFAVVEELPPQERRVGIALVEEMDPVTGLESLAIRFRDNAPRTLTEAIMRGRRIERGLGLAGDLLAKNKGLLNVENLPREARQGWTKAVVVRLPRAESGEEDADEEAR